MTQIRIYKKKIKSAKNIAKITRAMQMVAASKMKRAQDAASAGKSYARGILKLSNVLAVNQNEEIHPLLTNPSDAKKELVLLMAPEKGLCGSLISNLLRLISKEGFLNSGDNYEFILIGKKAINIAHKSGIVAVAEFELGLRQPKYDLIPPIARLVRERFLSGEILKVRVIYSDFINTVIQVPTNKVLLPLKLVAEEELSENGENDGNGFYIYEPNAYELAAALLDRYLELEIYQLVLEAYASEQSARMMAMKNATDNATELIDELTIEYNKVRQASITSEILDVGNATQILTQ